MKIIRLLLIFTFIFFISCNHSDKADNLPEEIKELEQLKVYSTEEEPTHTIELVPKVIYESNEEVFIEGSLKYATVDDEGRLYIGSTIPGKVGIYVFDSKGAFIKKLSNYGRGPGEFEAISDILVNNKILYILDARLQKIGYFSTDNLIHIKDELIKTEQIKNKSKFTSLMKGVSLNIIEGNELLIEMAVLDLRDLNEFDYTKLYPINFYGEIGFDPILKMDKYLFYILQSNNNSNLKFGFTPPFSRSTLYETSTNGFLYTAWTEDFLIKKYDSRGNYLSTIFYPWKNSDLYVNELGLSKERLNIVKKTNVPKTWPALHTLELDDEGRIWVATITKNDSTYQWWVLNEEGKLLAKFQFPGMRSKQSVFSGKPLIIIKSGYFYYREYDYDQEIDRIIKYKIKFKEREE